MKKSFIIRLVALTLVIVSVFSITAVSASAETKYVKVSQGPGHTVNIRKTASATGTKLGAITYGSAVTVLGTSGDWTQIQCYDAYEQEEYGTSTTAFIKTEFLTSPIPSDTWWIARYGTRDHKQTNTWYTGADNLQRDLNSYFENNNGTSYSWYPLTVDGYCGANTVSAIKVFQRKNGLTADGVAGNLTKEYLYKILNPEGKF